MNDYMNNPMMDMFKKSMENPMAMWSQENWNKTMETVQNSEMGKGFNPGNWMSMSGKMMENMPWFNAIHQNNQAGNMFNFAENTKNVEMVADMHKLSLENAQAMLRRQAEVIQKHSADLYNLMQKMVASPNPEAAMSMQTEYMHIACEALMADFKELTEMYSKANLENFESASCKVSEHMQKIKKATCTGKNQCHSHDEHDHHKQESETKKSNKK